MKTTRAVFFALAPVWLFAGLYSGLRVFWLLLVSEMLLVLAVLALHLWTVRTFSFSQKLDASEGVKGSGTALRILLENERPIPLALMEVTVQTAAEEAGAARTLSLGAWSRFGFEAPVPMPYRGVYHVGMTLIRLTDFFGLLPFRFDLRSLPFYRMPELVVWPRAEAPPFVPAEAMDERRFAGGLLFSAEAGTGLSGARKYRPGDPLKRVHWKKSAQRGELFVKQYDVPLRESVFILLDNSDTGRSGEWALIHADTACECACALATHSLRAGRAVSAALTDGVSGAFGEIGGLSAVPDLQKWLAFAPFGAKARHIPEALTGAPGGASLYFITGRPDAEVLDILAEARADFASVTLVAVGDAPAGGAAVHTLSVPYGADVFSALGGAP